MTTGLKTSVANSVLEAIVKNTGYTGPAAIWVKLHVGDPGSAGSANAAANTTRMQATFAAASSAAIANSGDIVWTSVSTTETYTHFTLYDASTAGNFIASGTVTGGAVTAGNDFKAAAGQLTVTLSVAA